MRNRVSFLQASVGVNDEVMALAFEETAMMLKYYHDHIVTLQKLNAGNEVLEAVTSDSRILFFVPVDMIYWTEASESLFDTLRDRAKKSGFTSWELVTAGTITPEAENQLNQRQFNVRANFNGR